MSDKKEKKFIVVLQEPFTKDELDRAKKAIDSALVRGFLILPIGIKNDKKLYAGRAFFAQLVLRPRYEPSDRVPTAATDGKKVYYNPRFINTLTPDQLIGLLAHEALHPGLAHQSRCGDRDHRKFNIAADLEINPILREAGFDLPPGGLFPGELPDAKEEAACREQCKAMGWPYMPDEELRDAILKLDKDLNVAERYYDCLPDSQEQDGQGGGDGAGGGEGQMCSDPGRCGGVMDAGDAAAQAASKSEWQKAMAQAADAAARKGDLPGGLARFVEQALEPSVDWRDVLRDFLVRSMNSRDDYNWNRPNRRFIGGTGRGDGIYMPGLVGERFPEFVVHIDTSGSTAPYLEAFAGELNGVLALAPCKVTIVYGDAMVQRVDTWQPGDGDIEFRPDGGGGTDHAYVWEWLREAEVDPVAVICVTDNETSHGQDPGLPVLWAIPEGHSTKVPFGRAVEITSTKKRR